MRLATAEQLTERLAVNAGMAGVAKSADSALNGATPIVELVLGSPLEYASRIDFYDFFPGRYGSPYLVNERFYLTQMFVDGAIAVYISPDGGPIVDLNGLTPVTEGVSLFPQLGEFLLTSSVVPEGRSVIAVAYSAGFDEEDQSIPSWLREAGISVAVRILHAQSISHNKKDVAKTPTELHRIAHQQLGSNIRTRTRGREPSFTTVDV